MARVAGTGASVRAGLSPAAFTRALLEAGNFSAIVSAVDGLAQARALAVRIALFWSTKHGPIAAEMLRCSPRRARAWADPAKAVDALRAEMPQQSPSHPGLHMRCWPLHVHASGAAILQVEGTLQELAAIEHDPTLSEGLELLARRVASVLEAQQLRTSVRRLERAERLQRALYAIADLASSDRDEHEVLQAMHRIVGGLMYAENFFIVLYDAGRKTLRFAYFADTRDTDVPDPAAETHEDQFVGSLTVALLHHGRALMGSSAELSARFGLAADAESGPDSEAWLGVPMAADNEVRGAVVVQSYDHSVRYRASDLALLGYVTQHILVALTRRRARDELERQVQLRTRELSGEVQERKAGERLQAALFRIAELTNTSATISEFCAAVHAVIGQLLYAHNFFVALLVDNDSAFDFPYAVDEVDPSSLFQRRKLRRGLTEHVLRSGKPLLVDEAKVGDLVAAGAVESIGTTAVGWLGVPLIMNDRVAGVLVVQSYTPGIGYSARDQELLSFVALHVATALQRRQVQESLKAAYQELQGRIEELRRTQAELIENEKMASLGRLVAGVAHEINTPLGIGITAASNLQATFATIDRLLSETAPTDLRTALAGARRCVELVLSNLDKAGQLVRSFKQVAVDQSDEVRRRIVVRRYLEEVLASLHPRLKSTPHRIELDCPADIELDTFPGALYQIAANLVLNALMHAFDADKPGVVRISASKTGDVLEMIFADDGKGMSEEIRRRAFEPFFTTRRGSGGTGLGLHLVYNLVTQVLRGTIACISTPGHGTQFTIRVPLIASTAAPAAAIYATSSKAEPLTQ